MATKLKREIVKVRRQLALQKGERLFSDDDDVMSPATANESTASEAEDKSQDDDAGDESSPERQVVQVSKSSNGRKTRRVGVSSQCGATIHKIRGMLGVVNLDVKTCWL